MHSHYTSCFHGYYDQFNNYFLRGQIKEKLKTQLDIKWNNFIN